MSNKVFADFINWIERINQFENVPTDLSAFNFGLFETTNGYAVYMIGAKIFNSENNDWACGKDFTPKERYFYFPVTFKSKSWQDVLSLTVEFTASYVNSSNFKQSFLANAAAITVGFDDGDLVRII